MNILVENFLEILVLLKKYRNGDAADLMRARGLNYAVNLGISLSDLKRIAAQFEPNFELAAKLRKGAVRERFILADLLDEPEKHTLESAFEICRNYPTAEVAELGANHFLYQLPFAEVFAEQLIISNSELAQISALTIFARYGQVYPSLSEIFYRPVLDNFEKLAASENNLVLRALARALRQSAKYLPNINEIRYLIEKIQPSHNRAFVYLNEEVIALI